MYWEEESIVHMSDLHFINTRLSKEICVCILLVHEIPWTFTSSKFIDIFFLHDSMPRAYKTKWVKVDIFIQSVLNMS